MEDVSESRRRLYGPERTAEFRKIQKNLTKSHVLQDGEYNFTSNKLKHGGIWLTSHDRDFFSKSLDVKNRRENPSQLVHHFRIGNDSGTTVHPGVYRHSTTMADFLSRASHRPRVYGMDNTINWPDMAPRYLKDRTMGGSEYSNTFSGSTRIHTNSAPSFPKVDTSKMKLPLDPSRFWLQRNTNFSLGSDATRILTEHQRVFGKGPPTDIYEHVNENPRSTMKDSKRKTSETLKNMEWKSCVFREGDYNDMGGSFVSTVNNDYGPRTLPPGEAAVVKIRRPRRRRRKHRPASDDSGVDSSESRSSSSIDDELCLPNQLTNYAQQVTVPIVLRDAAEGRRDQENAHFRFGSDSGKTESVYSKDFLLGSLLQRHPPVVHSTPSAGNLLQCDPSYTRNGITSHSVDFSYQPALPHITPDGKSLMEQNMSRRHGNNVVLTYDPSSHKEDRQSSLFQSDFLPPPKEYKPLKRLEAPQVVFDYLHTNDALPYPVPASKQSESKNSFFGTFMKGMDALERRRQKDSQCRDRLDEGRKAHFILGDVPADFTTETSLKFTGSPKDDKDIPFAGKSEVIPESEFTYLNISENTEDLKAADPYVTSSNESILARRDYSLPEEESAFTTSVMKTDYGPPSSKTMTSAQIKAVEKCNIVESSEVAGSHLFHTDNTGRNNWMSTTMDDFMTPEEVTGQKLLAAR